MMMFSKRARLIFFLFLCGATYFSWREFSVRPDGNVTVTLLDIGQGDSIFITGPSGQQIVVDGGPDLSALEGIGRRMSLFDRTIDLVILSHPHLDHLFALAPLLERYHIGAVLITGVHDDLARYEEFLSLIQKQQIPVIIADPEQDINLGDGLFVDVVWPLPHFVGSSDADANNTSVIFKLIYGEDSVLFTGDMEEREEEEVLASGQNIQADILKVAHHGSISSTSTGFLLAVNLELAVISAGTDNQFGHPHQPILRRLEHFDIPVRVTSWEGAIELELDGKDSL